MIVRLVVLASMVLAMLWALRSWRQAIRLVLVLVIVEGAIRKWLLPDAQELVYFAKDFVLLGAYAGCLGSRQVGRFVPRFRNLGLVMGLSALWGALEMFNPALPSIFLGILGFKAYFWYLPLCFVVPASFRDTGELERFLRRYVLWVLPIALLAVAQFSSPATSVLNSYAWEMEAGSGVATFGEARARVTGTFSYISGFTAYLCANAFLLLALLAVRRWRVRSNALLYVALALNVLSMIMSGSRAPIAYLLLLAPLFLILTAAKQRRVVEQFGRLAAVIAVAAALIAQAFAPATEAFLRRAETSGDLAQRIVAPVVAPAHGFAFGGFFGAGIGRTHQASEALLLRLTGKRLREQIPLEEETGRIMAELGPIGFGLVYALRLLLAVIAFRLATAGRSGQQRIFAAAALVFILASIPTSVVFNHTWGVFFWFFVGVSMLIARLRVEETSSGALAGARAWGWQA